MSRVSEGIANEPQTLHERVVSLAAGTQTLDPAKHANRLLRLPGAAVGVVVNLPKAKGTGDTYTFLLTAAQTSGSVIINATHDGTSNVFIGTVRVRHTSGNLLLGFASTTNDIITLNGTTTGGAAAGDCIVLRDVANGQWFIERGDLTSSGAQATPFSG